MSTITKEKNLIFIYEEENPKPYVFDINTAIFYGRSGKPIKSYPSVVRAALNRHKMENNLFYCLCYIGNDLPKAERYKDAIRVWDKIDSLNSSSSFARNSYMGDALDKRTVVFMEEHLKELKQYLEEHSENSGSVSHFVRTIEYRHWLKKTNLCNDEYLTDEQKNALYNGRFNDEQLKCAVYYYKKGLAIAFTYNVINILKSYFDCCDKLNKPYVKGDFIREYAAVVREYELRKTELDNEALYTNQMCRKNALEFSYGGLTAIIPTTTEEFINEGNAQSNCVARMYLPQVVENETNIVFIRKDNDINSSYITCEVHEGKIIQYLARYNQRVYNELALEFKELYQKHISENWE
jgi:hypothetical protein